MEKLKVVLSQAAMQPLHRTSIHHNIINLGFESGNVTKVDYNQIFSSIDSSVGVEILQPASVVGMLDVVLIFAVRCLC